ncbi:MAG TPA: hypothetical protein VNX47_12435 [Nevskia sp.]|nr:hypothetical protein [Nevskia sp.]
MNNTLDRLFAGLITSLRSEIIPRLDDEFARGQAYAAMDLLNNLRPRIDWAVGPLAEQIAAQLAAAQRIAALAPEQALPEELKLAPQPATGDALRQYRDALDEHLCRVLDALPQAPSAQRDAVRAVLTQYMKEQVRREVSLAAKPLFGEIAGNTSAKQS